MLAEIGLAYAVGWATSLPYIWVVRRPARESLISAGKPLTSYGLIPYHKIIGIALLLAPITACETAYMLGRYGIKGARVQELLTMWDWR